MSQKYKIAKKQDEQAAQASKPRPEERAPKRKEARWVVVVRAILLAIVAIALVSGVLLSTVTNALGEVLQTDTIDGSSVQQVQQQTNDIPDIEAAYAGLSTSDGQVLYTRSPDTQVPMASTTKIMTAVVALESGTSLDTPMKITDGAAGTEGSTANLKSGMVISFHDLLYGMLLPSGNDAAVAIAQNIATTESRFVDMMNSKASDLGMTSTHYADATGLSDTNHYTTVNDYLKLARYAMQNSTFRQIVSTPTYTMTTSDGTTITVQSTDEMSDYLQGTGITPLGIKTGDTDAAGYCFVGCAQKDGVELYSVVFDANTEGQRFTDTATLLEWGFRHYRNISLASADTPIGQVACNSWIDHSVQVGVPNDASADVLDLRGDISVDVELNPQGGSVTQGQTCGTITWTQGDDVVATSDLVAMQSDGGPDVLQTVGIFFQRIWCFITGAQTQADTSSYIDDTLPVQIASAPS